MSKSKVTCKLSGCAEQIQILSSGGIDLTPLLAAGWTEIEDSSSKSGLVGRCPKHKRKYRILDENDYDRIHLPEELISAKLGDVPEKSKPWITRYLDSIDQMRSQGAGLVLLGDPGVGKSSIAAIIAKTAKAKIGSAYTVFFSSVSDLREFLRNRIPFDGETTVFERCREVDFLILDNLRPEDATELPLNASVLEGLLQSRKSWKKPTIITTRMSPDEIRKALPSVYQAIYGSVVFLPIEGPDLREAKEDQLKKAIRG